MLYSHKLWHVAGYILYLRKIGPVGCTRMRYGLLCVVDATRYASTWLFMSGGSTVIKYKLVNYLCLIVKF
jgi:hypothetical protein